VTDRGVCSYGGVTDRGVCSNGGVTDRGVCSYGGVTLTGEYVAMVEWGKPRYREKSLTLCHYVHHKSDMEWPGFEPPGTPHSCDSQLHS